MNFKCCLTGMLLLSLKTFCHQIQPLTIGDAMPAIEIKGIFNYPVLSSNLAAFNNRLVILDFMASNCISCLKALPRLDSLQKKYGSKIQIFLVTYEKKEKVKFFLQHHKELRLPMIGEDIILSKYFPHTFISHEVWINNGVVKAITHADYVTKENIETVLSDAAIDWPVKRDIADYDYSKSLLNSDAVFYSAVTDYKNNVPPRFTVSQDSASQSIRTTAINFSLINLYLRTYGIARLTQNFIVDEVKGSDNKKLYCYESVLPSALPEQSRLEKIRNDLDMYFSVQGRMEMRNVSCYVITRDTFQNTSNQNSEGKKISLQSFVSAMNEHLSMPIIDESGYAEKVIPPANFSDLSMVREALQKFNLKIIIAARPVKLLIITKL